MAVRISIVILTKNAGSQFKNTLRSVFDNDCQEPFEVIAIDSSSKDETLKILKGFPVRVHTIKPVDFGHGRTRNLGMRLAEGEIVVFLTQDAIPADKKWLMRLTSHFGDENVAGVFGRQLPKKDASPMEEFFLNVNFPESPIVKKAVDRYSLTPSKALALQPIFFSDVNSAIRKYIWEKHNFKEDLIMSEDQQWSKDVMSDGYKIIYDPYACVYHSHSYNLINLLKRNFDSGASLTDIVPEKTVSVLCGGCYYVIKECFFLIKKRKILWMPYLLIYEFVRFIGFFIGRRYKYIPIFLKRRLSQYPDKWKINQNIA